MDANVLKPVDLQSETWKKIRDYYTGKMEEKLRQLPVVVLQGNPAKSVALAQEISTIRDLLTVPELSAPRQVSTTVSRQ